MEFEELRDRAGDVASATSKKVAEIYATAKIKFAIGEKRSELRTLYRELGKLVYDSSKGEADENVNNDIEDKIAEIDIVKEVISELLEQEESAKNTKICPYCDERVPESAKFCPNCGREKDW